MKGEQTAGTDESSSTPANDGRTLENFSKLLRENMPPSDDEGDGTANDGESQGDDADDGEQPPARTAKSKKPKSLKAAAEMLGVEVEDLYSLEIPSSRQGEKPYTLGTLKDLAASEDDHTVRTLQLDADRRSFERERVTAETEIRETLALLPEDALKPEALKKLRAGIETKHAREREAILKVIPEWSDEAVRLQDMRAMVEYLKGYGLPETTLMEHFDHRIFRFVRNAMRIQQAVDKALGKVKERRSNTPPKGQARGETSRRAAQPKVGDARQERQVRGFFETIAAAAAKT